MACKYRRMEKNMKNEYFPLPGKTEIPMNTDGPFYQEDHPIWRHEDDKENIPYKLSLLAKEMQGKCSDISILDQPFCSSFLPNEIGKDGTVQGRWDGIRGDSIWIPNDNSVPKQGNPDGKTWGEIKDKYQFDGIEFKDGEPDFSIFSEATVEIEDFTTDRNSNFTQADERCADKWTNEQKDGKSWTAADVEAYRKENKLTWHERTDQKTIDLVPAIIHSNVPHSGGISAAKNGENK